MKDMNKYRLYFCATAFLVFCTPQLAVQAQVNVDAAQSNNSQNAQTNSGSVQNVGILNQTIGQTYFGPGISCPTPSLSLNGFGSSTGEQSNIYGGTFSLIIPLGGKVGKSCRGLTEEILIQRKLDTSLTLAKTCIDFSMRGVTLDPQVYPDLSKACNGVAVKQTLINRLR